MAPLWSHLQRGRRWGLCFHPCSSSNSARVLVQMSYSCWGAALQLLRFPALKPSVSGPNINLPTAKDLKPNFGLLRLSIKADGFLTGRASALSARDAIGRTRAVVLPQSKTWNFQLFHGLFHILRALCWQGLKSEIRLQFEHVPHLGFFKQSSLSHGGRGRELGPGKLKWISSLLITRLGLSINRPPSPLASVFKEVTAALSCSHPRFSPGTVVVLLNCPPLLFICFTDFSRMWIITISLH